MPLAGCWATLRLLWLACWEYLPLCTHEALPAATPAGQCDQMSTPLGYVLGCACQTYTRMHTLTNLPTQDHHHHHHRKGHDTTAVTASAITTNSKKSASTASDSAAVQRTKLRHQVAQQQQQQRQQAVEAIENRPSRHSSVFVSGVSLTTSMSQAAHSYLMQRRYVTVDLGARSAMPLYVTVASVLYGLAIVWFGYLTPGYAPTSQPAPTTA